MGPLGEGSAGDGVKQITNSSLGFYAPAWSGDERYLYAFQAVGGNQIFRIHAQGGSAEPLFEGESPMTTKDGHAILYGKMGHLGVFSRSLDGDPADNPEEKLVDDYIPGADLSPVQDGFYYTSWNGAGKPRAVRFYSYVQKKALNVAMLPDLIPNPADLAVSPDRRRLVYTQFSGLGTDLTLIEFH